LREKEALKLNPYYNSYSPFWSLLGAVLQKLGENEEAIECFDRRIEIEGKKKNPLPPSSCSVKRFRSWNFTDSKKRKKY
jgi:tetratricopeptide (TPR) repeat protein